MIALVVKIIQEDPFSGHLFVFRNARRDRLKLLWWDRDGLAIFYKRLERGRYQFPTDSAASRSNSGDQDTAGRCEIRADELALLLEGIELSSVKRRPHYERPADARPETPTVAL